MRVFSNEEPFLSSETNLSPTLGHGVAQEGADEEEPRPPPPPLHRPRLPPGAPRRRPHLAQPAPASTRSCLTPLLSPAPAPAPSPSLAQDMRARGQRDEEVNGELVTMLWDGDAAGFQLLLRVLRSTAQEDLAQVRPPLLPSRG